VPQAKTKEPPSNPDHSDISSDSHGAEVLPVQGYPTAPPPRLLGACTALCVGAPEQHLFWCLLVAEHGQDGEKEERRLTQASKDLLEEDEEPFEPESRVVFSRKRPNLDLRPSEITKPVSLFPR
jgi:hypothetical protein